MLNLRLPGKSLLGQSLLVLALLLGQQGSALHSLGHAFAEQTQQQKKHSAAEQCELCPVYAQLSGSLNSAGFSFDFVSSFGDHVTTAEFRLHARHTLAALARGPPAFQQSV